MTLVDTSAWIEFFRGDGDAATKRTVGNLVLAGEAAVTCPVRLKLLQGARDAELADLLDAIELCERWPSTPDHWDAAAGIARELRKRGRNIPVSDILIALCAITNKASLLARDRHFRMIQEVLNELELASA